MRSAGRRDAAAAAGPRSVEPASPPSRAWPVGAAARDCREPLARRYVVVDVTCGVLWGLAGLVIGWSVVLVPVLALVTGFVAMSVVDLVLMRIPTRFVYVTAAAFLAGIALWPWSTARPDG